jgi:aminoglycoside phosphotransferase (APT) family kinase protein
MRATGIANDIWALGDDLVLRVGRESEEAWSDARTESVAVPPAGAAGVCTPALVGCDLSRSIVDAPITIYERVHGDTLGLVLDSRADWSTALYGLGRDLARLHLEVTHVDDPHGWLDTHVDDPHRWRDAPVSANARAWLDVCSRKELLGVDALALFARWLDHLEAVALPAPALRFLHGDAHALNVMVDDAGDYLALLDWGDAGWGDPALELATFPIDAIDPLLAGYADAGPELVDDALAARVLVNQIGHALRKLAQPRDPRQRTVAATRLHCLAAFASHAAASWRPWLPAR